MHLYSWAPRTDTHARAHADALIHARTHTGAHTQWRARTQVVDMFPRDQRHIVEAVEGDAVDPPEVAALKVSG